MLLFPNRRLDFTRNTYLTVVYSVQGVLQRPEGLEIVSLLDPFSQSVPCFSHVPTGAVSATVADAALPLVSGLAPAICNYVQSADS